MAPKKGKKVKSEQDADEMAIEEPIPAPSKATAKKGKPAKVKDFEAEEAVKSKTKAAAKKTEVAPKGEAPEDADRTAAAPKKAKAVGKKGKKTTEVEEADAEAPEQGAPPKKAAGRPSKAKHDDTEAPSPVPGGDDQPVQAGKKAGAGKNAPNTKKPVVKKAEKNAGAEKPEAPIGEAPKAKRGRNKADKSS